MAGGEDVPVTGQRVVRRALGRRLTRLRVASGKSAARSPKPGWASPSRRCTASRPARYRSPGPTCGRCAGFTAPTRASPTRWPSWRWAPPSEEWWDASPVIPDWFKLYVGLEASACRICSYDGEIVPGELQTEQYARAVFGAEQPPDSEAADRHVKLRMQRQKTLFARRPAPQLVTVLGEGALTRPVGGETRAQGPDRAPAAGRTPRERRHPGAAVLGRARTPRWPARSGSWTSTTLTTPTWSTWSPTSARSTWRKRLEVDEYRRIFDLISKDAVPVEEFR